MELNLSFVPDPTFEGEKLVPKKESISAAFFAGGLFNFSDTLRNFVIHLVILPSIAAASVSTPMSFFSALAVIVILSADLVLVRLDPVIMRAWFKVLVDLSILDTKNVMVPLLNRCLIGVHVSFSNVSFGRVLIPMLITCFELNPSEISSALAPWL